MATRKKYVLALGLILALGSCHKETTEEAQEWNVLLVTLDTLRADRLGCYGREQANTPNLDRLALEGVRFENAFSTSGTSSVSHASILTGQNNDRHGLRVERGASGERISAGVSRLPHLLAARGWRTAAFVSAAAVSERHGFDSGYEHFRSGIEGSAGSADAAQEDTPKRLWRDARRAPNQRRADATTDQGLTWLEEHGENGPWHLWMHYYDAHDLELVPPVELAEAASITYDASIGADNVAVREELYDLEVGYVDQQIGRLLEYLRLAGQYEHTLIVVVGDHGQGLSDGLEHHGWMLDRLPYNWCLHVPLIMKLPEHSGSLVVNEWVRTIDVLPTILEQLDLAALDDIEGRSVLPMLRGELDEPRLVYADCLNLLDASSPGERLPEGQNDNLYVVMDRRWKLIYHAQEPANSELYHLEEDPAELENVYGKRPAATARLQAILRERGIDVVAPPVATPVPEAAGN